MDFTELLVAAGAAGAALALGARRVLRSRGLDRWLPEYIRHAGRRGAPRPGEPVHLLLCVADHFEPRHDATGPDAAHARVGRWAREYPRLFGGFRDADGRPPRHSFFYPIEQYDPYELDV